MHTTDSNTPLAHLRRLRRRFGKLVGGRLGIATVAEHTRRLVEQGKCRTGLDIGCGVSSHLSALRPVLKTFGVDADEASVEESRQLGVHDAYAVADVIQLSVEELRGRIEQAVGLNRFDVVTAYGVIEHLPKREGWKFLEKLEALSRKYVVLETPNGFVPQGPEFGNPLQRHQSGWFPHEFESFGYRVIGTTGTKHLRGYMGQAKAPVPGVLLFDQVIFSRVLRADRKPHHAFNLCAIKDVRGVPAKYASRDDFHAGRSAA